MIKQIQATRVFGVLVLCYGPFRRVCSLPELVEQTVGFVVVVALYMHVWVTFFLSSIVMGLPCY